MKKRNPFAVFILSIITLGIYDLYWLVVTKKVLNQKTKIHTPTIWLLILPIFLAVVSIIIFVANSPHTTTTTTFGTTAYSTSNSSINTNGVSGLGIAGLIGYIGFILVFIVTSFYWFFKFSKAVAEFTKGKMSMGLAFVLLWILHFIGVALIQDTFNDL